MGVAAAAILDSVVAVAAVGYRIWGVALPSPPGSVVVAPPSGGGATAVASRAMAATTANPGEETEDWGASKEERLKGLATGDPG